MNAPALPPRHVWMRVQGGWGKTGLLHALALKGAEDDLVRNVAARIVRSERDDRKRIERLHRFVATSVPYYREPVEMFQPPALTLTQGGDCDDHVLTLCALAWALRLPFACEPYVDADDPAHYTCRLGYPGADQPWGDLSTTWLPVETTISAATGEHVSAAVRRGAQ